MGSNENNKWLEQLKSSVQNHSEQLPDDFWESLHRDIPKVVPVQKRYSAKWVVWATSVAAVLVLGLFLLWPQQSTVETLLEENAGSIAVVTESDNSDLLELEDTNVSGIQEPEIAEVWKAAVVEDQQSVAVEIREAEVIEEREPESIQVQEQLDIEVQEPEKVDTVGQDRSTYLKELEYLYKEDIKKRNKNGWLAFAGGRGEKMIALLPKEAFATPPYASLGGAPTAGTELPEGGTDVVFQEIGGILNLASLSNNNVVWNGANGPLGMLNGYKSYKSLSYSHSRPLKFGCSFVVELRNNLFAESGIVYQYLKSEAKGNIGQKLHYVGIPLKLGYSITGKNSFSAYGSAGVMVEKCVYGTLEADGRRNRLSLGDLQPSLTCTIGLQLKLGGSVALYFEPGIYYYMGMEPSGEISREYGYIITNFYSENPFGISMQGGLRFSL